MTSSIERHTHSREECRAQCTRCGTTLADSGECPYCEWMIGRRS